MSVIHVYIIYTVSQKNVYISAVFCYSAWDTFSITLNKTSLTPPLTSSVHDSKQRLHVLIIIY